VLYLYGITDARALPETLPLGLEERAVAVLPFNGIAAVTGELTAGRPEASERHLREHFRVVEAFMARDTVLPVRFGTAFAGVAELLEHLARGHDVYASDLRRLRGVVELSVRAERRRGIPALPSGSGAALAAADGGPGTRYLAERLALAAHGLAQQREAQALAGMLMERLAAQAAQVEWRALALPSGAAGVSMAFLLPKERLDGFREAAGALGLAAPDLDILLTGPWPPYSFVSALEAADALSGIS
jgi:hypothetical protein